MSLSDLASLGSFVSGFAVLVSLVFLYFQLRQVNRQVEQTERNQQAVIRQGRTNALVEMNLRVMDPALAAIVAPVSGEPVGSDLQLNQLQLYMLAWFQHLQENFDQHREGLLNEKDFEAFVRSAAFLARLAGFRVVWRRLKPGFEDEFASFMDDLIARTPLRKPAAPGALMAQFNLDIQGELANAK